MKFLKTQVGWVRILALVIAIGAGEYATAHAQKKTSESGWSLVTAVYQVENGEYDAGTWLDVGVAKMISPFLGGHVSVVVRIGAIQENTPSAFGADLYYTEPITPWLDAVVGVGGNQKLIEDGTGDWSAAFVTSVAAKFKNPKGRLFGGPGARIFQDDPGKLKSWAVGFVTGLKL